MEGEVVVLGDYNRLSLWNHDRFKQQAPAQKLTDEDLRVLSEAGI
jgi:DNA-binding transcriptional regulator/RsmH inhibitor MraZ